LTVSLSQVLELVLEVFLLLQQLIIQILVLAEVSLQSRDLGVSVVQRLLLTVQLGVKVSILLFAIDEKVSLIIDFLSESGDHADVGLDARFIIILHASLFIGYSVEILLQVQELVLEGLVLPLSVSQLVGFLSQLCNKSVFVILVEVVLTQFSLRALGHCLV